MAWHVAAPALLLVTLAATLPAIGARLSDLVKALLPVILACLGMAASVIALSHHAATLPPLVQLALETLVGAAVYAGMLHLFWPHILAEAWAMLRRPTVAVTLDSGLVSDR